MQIAFFPQRELHLPILTPLYQAFSEMGHSCHLVLKDFQSELGEIPEEGIKRENQLKLQREFNCIKFDLNLKFDLTFTADFVLDYTEDWGKQCCVGHGTISKNTYFLSDEIAWRENFHEFLVVPGQAYQESFGGKLSNQVLPLGFPKLDSLNSLLNQKAELKSNFRSQHNIPVNKKILLFAPTYNDEFQSYSTLYSIWDQIIDQGYFVIFKLHGATKRKWVESYESLAKSQRQCIVWNHQDISEAMVISDLMISDLSSVCIEYYLTQQPLFVYNNPHQSKSKFYNPQGIEFRYRDGAYEFDTTESLIKQLHLIESDDHKGVIRFKHSQKLFPARATSIVQSIANHFSTLSTLKQLSHTLTHPINISVHPGVTALHLEHLLNHSYFPLRFMEKERQFIEGLLGSTQSVKRITWNSENNELPTLHYLGDGFLPRNWDLKWQVSQQLVPQQGKIGFINQHNLAYLLNMDLKMDEIGRQKFLSYRGFSRFFEGKILSKSFIQTHSESGKKINWAGLYLADAT